MPEPALWETDQGQAIAQALHDHLRALWPLFDATVGDALSILAMVVVAELVVHAHDSAGELTVGGVWRDFEGLVTGILAHMVLPENTHA